LFQIREFDPSRRIPAIRFLCYIFSSFSLRFLFVRIPAIRFSVNFRSLSNEGFSNDLLTNGQHGAKSLTEIDYRRHPNAEFSRFRLATETFLNILVHG
jgi:hypothetical protein